MLIVISQPEFGIRRIPMLNIGQVDQKFYIDV
jgi:hypothetical protein